MSSFELDYLVLVVAVFVVFAGALAYFSVGHGAPAGKPAQADDAAKRDDIIGAVGAR